MTQQIKHISLFLLLFLGISLSAQEQKPSKEEVLRSIMDINVSEEEAIEILSKYYPELLNPVVEAKKDYETASTVQNSDADGLYFQQLGEKSLAQKDYDQAIIYFQKSIIKKRGTQGGSEKHPAISKSYQKIGEAYEGKNDPDEALKSYQRSLISNASDFDESDLLRNPPASNMISNTLAIPIFEAKGDLLLQSSNDNNQLLAALISYERGVELLDLICKKYTSEYTKLQLSQQIAALSEKAIQAALRLYQATRDQKYKNKVFSIAEKGKAMILTSSLLEARSKDLSAVPEDILRREKQLKTNIAQLSQKLKTKKQNKENIKKGEQKLFALTQALFFLQDSLKTYYPKHEYLKYAPPGIAMDSLQAFLAMENMALVEYFFGEKYAFAFTITGDQFHISRLEDQDQLQENILALRQHIQARTFKKDAEAAFRYFGNKASLIYSSALEKALAPLDKSIQSLVIIPDGPLWLIPFELLLYDAPTSQNISFSPDNLPYLLNKYAISYASSGRLLLQNSKRVSTATDIPFAGFAPAFENDELAARSCNSEDAILGQLDFNQSELEGIASYFSGQPHFGRQATRAAFLESAPKAEIIHLSTHACMNKEDPMDSRIFFAQQQYLTTEEIYTMQTSSKMAVLSACQTGLGKVYKSEGMISLARAFTKAGCPSVTMSLWPVADEATAQIMVNYYKNLDNGINKSEALRLAKLDYLSQQTKSKQHPYYWAAFVHIGDFSPIQTAKSKNLIFWGILVGGILVMAIFFLKRR